MTSWRSDIEASGYIWLDNASAASIAAELGRPSAPMRLEPRERGKARPRSLSGAYGLDAFPWHTDGAISSNPPRWLLLKALELSNPARTELLIPDHDLMSDMRRTTLRAVDRTGQLQYLPAVVMLSDHEARIRWDPRTCTPRTGLTITDMESKSPTAHIKWTVGGLLVIDNYRILHRRPEVHGQAKRVLERTYVWES